MSDEDDPYEAAEAAARLDAWFQAEGPLVMDEADFNDVQTVLAENERLRTADSMPSFTPTKRSRAPPTGC